MIRTKKERHVVGFMTTAATERAKLLRDRPLSEIAPIRWWLRFSLDRIHGLFYDARIFGSVNSLTSRQLLPVKALI
jgi:hypothetical protein